MSKNSSRSSFCNSKYPVQCVFLNSDFSINIKNCKSLPVYKNGDKTDAIDYIPICIHLSISKTIKKIICSREADFLMVNNVTTQKQIGFKKLQSAKCAVLDVVLPCYDSFEKNYFLAYFLRF